MRLVAKAGSEEMGDCMVAPLHRMNIYLVVDVKEALAETGKPPISLRWVDMGSIAALQIRSRLVVREMRCETPELTAAKLFSAMPPLRLSSFWRSFYPRCGRASLGYA